MRKAITLITFTLMFGFFSCNKTTPSGFWADFKKDFLINNISDQGTSGGHRAMQWKAERQKTFNSKEIIDFAVKNGWVFMDSLEVQTNELKTWNYNSAPIFPLSHTGFSVMSNNNSTHKYFPRWINTNLKIYKFKTGWTAIEPGTDNSIDENGFVILNIDGNEMSVYHLWGE